jgi:hypothetical protein
VFLFVVALLSACWSKLALLFGTFGETSWSRLALLLGTFAGGPGILLGTRYRLDNYIKDFLTKC